MTRETIKKKLYRIEMAPREVVEDIVMTLLDRIDSLESRLKKIEGNDE